MDTLILKQYDSEQGYRIQLSDKGLPDPVPDAEVHLMFGNNVVPGVIEDEAQGIVLFHFTKAHTSIPGTFTFDIKVRFSDGNESTYPTEGYGVVVILQSKEMGA